MMRKGFNSSVRICVLVLFAMSLVFVCSCKKSEPAPTKAPDKTETPAASDKVETAKVPDKGETAKAPDKTEAPKVPDKVETPAAGGLAPIELELPKPMFVGTPQDTRVENLEKPTGKPRPPFLAPAGTKNVAEGKPVSSSDEEPIIGEI